MTVWLAGGRVTGRPLRRVAGVLAFAGMALIVACYFSEFEGERFERVGGRPANWQTYGYTLAAAVVAAASYLVLSGGIAIRNIMYANDANAPAQHSGM